MTERLLGKEPVRLQFSGPDLLIEPVIGRLEIPRFAGKIPIFAAKEIASLHSQ